MTPVDTASPIVEIGFIAKTAKALIMAASVYQSTTTVSNGRKRDENIY